MRFLLFISVLGVGALMAAWASPSPARDGTGSWTVRCSPREEAVTARLARELLKAIEPIVGPLFDSYSPNLADAFMRGLIGMRAMPLVALAVSAAVLAGLVVRESARLALRFSSPTWNFVGKRLAALAAVALVILPLLPAPVPAWACCVAVALIALGIGLYVANLPVRL